MPVSPATTPAPFSGTQSGSILSTRSGAETFTRTIANQNGTRSTDAVFKLADGKTATRDTNFTPTATGWTRSITTTLADGKTTTLQETGTRQADGSVAISGTFTNQNGQTQTVTGRRQADDTQTDLTFTNAAGQTRTQDAQSIASGDQVLRTVNGTSFGGVAFSDTSALAVRKARRHHLREHLVEDIQRLATAGRSGFRTNSGPPHQGRVRSSPTRREFKPETAFGRHCCDRSRVRRGAELSSKRLARRRSVFQQFPYSGSNSRSRVSNSRWSGSSPTASISSRLSRWRSHVGQRNSSAP